MTVLGKAFVIPMLLALGAFQAMPFVTGCASTKDEDKSGSGKMEVARQFLASGDYRRAVAFLQPLAKENPKSQEIHNLLGLSYLGLGNPKAASQSFATVVGLDDDNHDAALNLSYSLILLGENARARSVLGGILDDGVYPYMERVHVNIGLAWMEQGRCSEAQAHFDKALLLDPTFVTAHFNSGKCWLKSNNHAAAVASFQKAVDFCPGCVDPVLELARARYLSGEKRAAVDSLEKLLRGRIDAQSADRTRKLLNEMKR